jgi:lipopolysaccharide-induced tumor necrosis factor-alpha factor
MNCTRCGKAIPVGSNFCQACGAPAQPNQPAPPVAYQPPPPPQMAPPAYAAPAPPYGVFVCPFCRVQAPPIIQKKVSDVGWVLFVVLLLCCFPLCWLPFVIDGCKEDVRRCSSCGTKLG